MVGIQVEQYIFMCICRIYQRKELFKLKILFTTTVDKMKSGSVI